MFVEDLDEKSWLVTTQQRRLEGGGDVGRLIAQDAEVVVAPEDRKDVLTTYNVKVKTKNKLLLSLRSVSRTNLLQP